MAISKFGWRHVSRHTRDIILNKSSNRSTKCTVSKSSWIFWHSNFSLCMKLLNWLRYSPRPWTENICIIEVICLTWHNVEGIIIFKDNKFNDHLISTGTSLHLTESRKQKVWSNLSMNGLIFARSSLDCHIFSFLSVDTHTRYPKSHEATWLYGFNTAIKPNYGHKAI